MSNNTERKYLLFLIMFIFFNYFGWSQSIYSVDTYQWVDKGTIPLFFEIPGDPTGDIHQVILRIDTHGNLNPPQFLLTYPNGKTDTIKAGYVFNTGLSDISGESISFIETSSGIYELAITRKPASGIFTEEASCKGVSRKSTTLLVYFLVE